MQKLGRGCKKQGVVDPFFQPKPNGARPPIAQVAMISQVSIADIVQSKSIPMYVKWLAKSMPRLGCGAAATFGGGGSVQHQSTGLSVHTRTCPSAAGSSWLDQVGLEAPGPI